MKRQSPAFPVFLHSAVTLMTLLFSVSLLFPLVLMASGDAPSAAQSVGSSKISLP